MSINPTDVGINPTEVSINPTDVSINLTDVGINLTDVSINLTDVGINLTDVGINPTDVGINPIDVSINPTDVGNKLMSVLSIIIMMKGIFDNILRFFCNSTKKFQSPSLWYIIPNSGYYIKIRGCATITLIFHTPHTETILFICV